ncbi:hypothetical protein LWI28_012300 [Acer negundo]|uniref:Fe2OG dioxygenase domain-containing protein n=1 Tax=Acer negundo TaxID=4023 RepID=A0AAD5P1J8_ACENE|nr:hypothetical protein LWI28_012300 [Acer negundo]KAK4856008.1 hypothetical protein QYF36_013221 [Acer negundo]
MNHPESYPPVFRKQINESDDQVTITTTLKNPEEEEEPKRDDFFLQDSSDPVEVVPVIDLQDIITNLEQQHQLEEACRDWGIFRLVNHGVPLNLISQLQDQAQKIFSMSFEAKQTLFNNNDNSTPAAVSYFWGTPVLTPSGSVLDNIYPKKINWVEGLNVRLSQLSDYHDQISGDPMLDSFRVLLEEYGGHMERLARVIFEAILKTLNMDSKQYNSKSQLLSESTSSVRVYRYPKISDADEEEAVIGMQVHTDSSVISILNQNQVGGLEVFKDNKWFHVRPILNELVVNLGDMMQAISNDEYASVKHRVKANKHEERFSICYFMFPAEDGVVGSSNYKPFTYKDFQAQVQHDVKTLGFKVGLERFKNP